MVSEVLLASRSRGGARNMRGQTLFMFTAFLLVMGIRPSVQDDRETTFKKKYFSNSLRFVAFLGLEGSGQALWEKVMEPCIQAKYCITDPGPNGAQTILWDSIKTENETEFTRLQTKLLNRIRGLRRSLSDTKQPKVVFLNLVALPYVGYVSYPNMDDKKHRVLQHPDVRTLAEVCHAGGVDLRFVVLLRQPLQVLDVTTVQHQMSKSFLHEARILNDNAAVLLGQLLQIDHRYYVCLDPDEGFTADTMYKAGVHMGTLPHPRLMSHYSPSFSPLFSCFLISPFPVSGVLCTRGERVNTLRPRHGRHRRLELLRLERGRAERLPQVHRHPRESRSAGAGTQG